MPLCPHEAASPARDVNSRATDSALPFRLAEWWPRFANMECGDMGGEFIVKRTKKIKGKEKDLFPSIRL